MTSFFLKKETLALDNSIKTKLEFTLEIFSN